ncbi:LuxR C-terminal-related transcriptional regulator [Aureimonas sp. N4]|uniref:LuxR C-terminal-related transcriptional regulator n=1 Tax=Aureimonas sp. N4 TaxID=1638165 RepID=UPI0035B56494
MIAAGHTTKTAAEYLAVSDETVRSHLKAAYTRLGIDRQADLVRLVGKVVPFET